jgi:hypothetical protein
MGLKGEAQRLETTKGRSQLKSPGVDAAVTT